MDKCDLLERLRRMPCDHVERVAQRLQQSDLGTLARFASPPHPLVHHVLAVLQTVLLSLSLLHQTTSALRMAPWPLLRLDVLANTELIWRKMWKRLARLRLPSHDPRRKPLANAQVRFVLEHVLTAPLLSKIETCQEVLVAIGRVSAIAESIAAYVLLSAHYSLVPPQTSKSSSPVKQWPLASCLLPSARSPPKRPLCVEPLPRTSARDPRGATTAKPHHRSWRCGTKYRGRFFLFRAALLDDDGDDGPSADPSGSPGSLLSGFAIDCRHDAFRWAQAVTSSAKGPSSPSDRRRRDPPHSVYARSWLKHTHVPAAVAHWIADYRRKALALDHTTTLSLLLQTAVVAELFVPPHAPLTRLLLPTPSTVLGPHEELRISMHIIVVATELDAITLAKALKLVAIGEIHIHGTESTLCDLRRQLVASCGAHTHCCHQQMASSSFHFFLHGAIVSMEDESWHHAIELLPIAVVCLDKTALLPRRRSKASSKHWRAWSPTLSTIRRALGSILSKQLTPGTHEADPPVVGVSASHVAVSLYGVEQSVASLPSSSPSPSPPPAVLSVSSTIDTLLALFINWSAFVQFQQLQDTSVILYEYGSPDKLKQTLQAASTETDAVSVSAANTLRPEPTAADQELLSLPHAPFCAEKEYLRPLYATFTFRSRRKAYLRSPYLSEAITVLAAVSEASPLRITVENAECVLHVVRVTRNDKRADCLIVRFARDLSCPLEMLATMRDAFVWCIHKLPKRSRADEPIADGILPDPTKPPRWLRDVFRFVSHPTWDFQRHPHRAAVASASAWASFPSRFFHVDVPFCRIEQLVEATLWSRGIDWTPHFQTCDIESELLRPKYEALCLAYPSAFALDSVKFSKLLRECGLQPQFLTVGDAAFLFTTHRAPGSHYEMIYDGFVDAIKWIAHRVLPLTQQTERDETLLLRAFCLEWLIRAPSTAAIWRRVVDQWRIVEKRQYMEKAAIEYCAATRIRANWKRLVVQRVLITTLTRLKNERRAATKLQSLYKMRKVRASFGQLRVCVVQTQRAVRARRQLRQLRVERAQLVDKMRVRLQKWMRQRLRVLRCWKGINAAWLARKARILEKRSRLVCAGAYQIESRVYRASLYRIILPPPPLRAPSGDTTDGSQIEDREFELELLEPSTGWFRSIRVAYATLEVLEHDAQTVLDVATPAHACQRNRWKLLVLLQRLHVKKRCEGISVPRRPTRRLETSALPRHWSESVLQIYRDPMETSLGRLMYHGSVQERDFYGVNASAKRRFVRLFLRAHEFTLVTYSPESSAKHRYTFTTSFVYQLFRVADWRGVQTGHDDNSDACKVNAMLARSFVVDALAVRGDKLLAIRLLLRYLVCHGSTPARRDMMPKALAQRMREQQERAQQAERAQRQRELALVISVQSATRRLLARRHVQSLAQRSYMKSRDPNLHQLVYTHRRIHDMLTYRTKPQSLREKDALEPVDEWLLSVDDATSSAKRYFNPRRGVFSPVNDVQAARRLQTWFRRTMWTRGFSAWDLRHLSQALLFHHHIHAPTNLSDRLELDQITNYALQRHLLEHDYKTASSLYEAALKLAPDHVPALVGLAVLLIFSCRYPAKRTWARGLQLLDRAKLVDLALASSLADMEQNCFRWAMYLHAKNAEAFGNYAVFLQCVCGQLDKAELLYRRAIDLDPANERIVENYLRLQRERTPEGIYSDAGPSNIAVWRAQEIRRLANAEWRELEDTGTRSPSAARFFQNIRTGLCVWRLPAEPDGENLSVKSTISSG